MHETMGLIGINGNHVFEKITKESLSFKLGCATSVNIWKDTDVHEELTINEQQKKDKPFAAMLDCVRCGCPIDETQPRWRTGSPWLLDRCVEEAGREGGAIITDL